MKTELQLPSSDGRNILHGTLWHDPSRPPKALVQIVHGMCEYIHRYEDFALYLVDQGYAVCGEDHLGHGRTAAQPDDLGYFGPKDGWNHLVEDVENFRRMVLEQFPGTPCFLLGHSMGSFISRVYMTRYGQQLTGAIICGTGGPNPGAGMGLGIAKLLCRVQGERKRSPLMSQIAFGQYNKRFLPHRTPYDWLTRDEAIVDRYAADPWCTFQFTNRAFVDLLTMIQVVSEPNWAKLVPQELPVLVFSGEEDPVGDYGKGVRIVHQRLKEAGVKDLSLILYPDGRHEILNESNRSQVYQDVASWLNRLLSNQ